MNGYRFSIVTEIGALTRAVDGYEAHEDSAEQDPRMSAK